MVGQIRVRIQIAGYSVVIAAVCTIGGAAKGQEEGVVSVQVAPTAPQVSKRIGHHEKAEGKLVEREDAGGVAAAGAVVTLGRFTSIQVNVDAFGNNIPGDAANEPSIAVDPTDHNRMAIGWREFASIGSAFRQSGWGHSQDGGQTWTFPGAVLPPPLNFASDPVLNFDAAGNFYYASLQTQRNACTWSVYMYKSFDGGVTWPQDVFAGGADKLWYAVDRTNGIGRDNLYMAYSPNGNASCSPGFTFSRSIDGGLTFETPLAPPGQQFSNTITVGPDGAVYNFGSSFALLPLFNLVKSSDAQDPSVVPTFELNTTVDLDGVRSFATGPNPGGLLGQAWVATDHSNGPSHGNVYALSSVTRISVTDPADVMFARSRNGGAFFESPIRLNDDPAGNSAYQWFGTMSVAPNGRIDVIWNDTRDDPTATFSQLMYTFSLDGGDTWSANEPVAPPFNSLVGFPVQQKIGDYYDMISDNTGADLAWAATFNGEEDVYYTRLTPDCNGNGIADVDDIANMTSSDCNGNSTPDECEPQDDCDGNLIQDICDVAAGAADCNHNFVPDSCEPNNDCNNNTVQDICDVADGTSDDCNNNDVPDSCELASNDCNGNLQPDDCDLATGISLDCNMNSVPDLCDIADGTSFDVDGDGIPDECTGACCTCGTCSVATAGACASMLGGIFQGAGVACSAVSCPLPPANDACEQAVVLASTTTVSAPFDSRCATTDGPATVVCEAPGAIPPGQDLWYEYTPPCCGLMTVDICSADFDAILGVYGGGATCGCPSSGTNLVQCSDDGCGVASGGIVAIPVTAGSCYTIQVAGFTGQGIPAGGLGTLNVSMTCQDGGPITTQPVGHWDVDPGVPGTFANGGAFADVWVDGDIVYQGQVNDNKVHMFDISDPMHPNRYTEWIVQAPNTGAFARDVVVGDGLLFISLPGDGFDAAEIVDVRDPFNPVHLSWITLPAIGDVNNTYYDNGYLYMTSGASTQLAVIDLTLYDPDNPPATVGSAKWTISVGTNVASDLIVRDSTLYVGAGNSGVFMYDVTNIATASPVLLAQGPPNPGTASLDVSTDGRWIVAAETIVGGALRLYEVIPDVGGPQILARQRFALPAAAATSPQDVSIVGTRVYVAYLEAGLQIYDIDETMSTLIPITSYASYFQTVIPAFPFLGAWGVFPDPSRERVILSDANTGLHVIRTAQQRLTISYPDGLLELIDPDVGSTLQVNIAESCDMINAATAKLVVNDGVTTQDIPLVGVGGDLFEAAIPPSACGTKIEYFVSVETTAGSTITDPVDPRNDVHVAFGGKRLTDLLFDDFETDQGWTTTTATCTGTASTGAWTRLDPNPTLLQPGNDFTPGLGTQCFVTGDGGAAQSWFSNDVDGGPFELVSPLVATGGADVVISYARWFYTSLFSAPGVDEALVVEVSTDGGATWIEVESVKSLGPQWVKKTFVLSDFAAPTATLSLRFTTKDCPGGSITEAAVDDVSVTVVGCSDCPIANPPVATANSVPKNRYVTFDAGNPGQQTAIRVTLNDLPPPHDSANGRSMWLGAPQQISETPGVRLSSAAPGAPSFAAAKLQCTPFVTDWGALGTIYVYGAEIIPDGQYGISEVDGSCPVDDVANFSDSLTLVMGGFGDLVGVCSVTPCTPPDGSVDVVTDIVAIIDKFASKATAPIKSRCDLEPSVPDQLINITDVVQGLEAFSGKAYPLAGPAAVDPCAP